MTWKVATTALYAAPFLALSAIFMVAETRRLILLNRRLTRPLDKAETRG